MGLNFIGGLETKRLKVKETKRLRDEETKRNEEKDGERHLCLRVLRG